MVHIFRVRRKQNVLQDRHVRKEGEALRNVTNPPLVRAKPDSFVAIVQRARANALAPARRLNQAGERLMEKALSRTGWT